METSLNGKTALVCGSSRGIGRASAEILALQGANLILVARNYEQLSKVQNEIPGQHQVLTADFSNLAEVKTLASSLENSKVDILVNNCGGPPGGQIHEAKIEEFELAFTQHLLSSHILMQAVTPGMRTRKFGRIINIISTSVKQPIKGLGVSNTIRGAMASWSKSLAGELAADGITVNNVLPGATKTQRLQTLLEAKSARLGLSFSELEKSELSYIPTGRFAEAEEVGQAIAFLASPQASYINGVNLPVDGGRTGSL